MGAFFGLPSLIYSSMVWVPEDTIYILPPMNANPDTITTEGFSGGSYYATLLHVTNSETIKGTGVTCGGPWGFGFSGSGKDDEWVENKVQEIIEQAQEYSDEGLIDDVANLDGAPVTIISALQDDAQQPNLQQAQKTFYEAFGGNVDLHEEDRGHMTIFDDALKSMQHLLPNIEGSGLDIADIVNPGGESTTFREEGYTIKFDQRAYTTPAEFSRAALAQWGHLYVPQRCADGTVESCHLMIYFYGCGGGIRLGEKAEASAGSSMPGTGAMAHANDQIILMPNKRDGCWNMEYKPVFGYANDPNFLKKDGAQNKAIMQMVERLLEAKDDQYDLTDMPNENGYFDQDASEFVPEGNETFWDNLGVWLSQNNEARSINTRTWLFSS